MSYPYYVFIIVSLTGHFHICKITNMELWNFRGRQNNITDALQIKSFLLQKTALTEAGMAAADTNADGAVSITDFLQLKAKLLGKSEITPN